MTDRRSFLRFLGAAPMAAIAAKVALPSVAEASPHPISDTPPLPVPATSEEAPELVGRSTFTVTADGFTISNSEGRMIFSSANGWQ